MKKAVIISLCVMLLLSACAVAVAPNDQQKTKTIPSAKPGDTESDDKEPVVLMGYEEAYKAIAALYNRQNTAVKDAGYSAWNRGGVGGTGSAPAVDFVEESAMMDDAAPEMAAPTSAPNPGSDYSETNTQVKGVDEGDIVKTDGEYIYILRDNELIILEAEGADTRIVSRTKLTVDSDKNGYKQSFEMYIGGDRLAIVSTAGRQIEPLVDRYGYWTDITSLEIYDISSRAKPKRLCEMGQEGYFLSSRMMDGYIYLISNYYVPSFEIDKDKPETYVPALYTNGAREIVDSGCVIICPMPLRTTAYTLVSAYDLKTGEIVSNQTVLGGGTEIYMSRDNLYLANYSYEEIQSAPRREDQYTVVEYNGKSTVAISRLSVDSGEVKFAASGTVDGQLLNQFSMDEYLGNLRVVTTLSTNSYEVYTDEKHGWNNYKWNDTTTSNALYVLDEDMSVVGSLTGLAEDERVYSVRFDGEVGYFVTFKQIDPLFAVNLSDPAKPEITSALKIPGFSTYMHVYGEGLLFGLGRDANEETGRALDMKLSMFDVSNKYDVIEKHKLAVESSYSEALYNHKAILISPERDIIAFPVEGGYDVYGYSADRGFYKRAHIKVDLEWGYGMRGLYAGEYAYICSYNSVSVMDMQTFRGVAQLSLA